MTAASIQAGRDLRGELTLSAQAVVVGTGAGGSVALRELARAGVDAIGLEEGGHLVTRDFDQNEAHMLPLLFQDRGGRATQDLAIRVLQGRGVGGSTVHNTNLCKRTPEPILDLWARRYGVRGCLAADLAPSFEAIEKDLSVSRIDDALLNGNNAALRRGVEALGWKGAVLAHNRVGCQLSGFCELGCAYDAKQNALKVTLPQALAAGARIYADVRAERVTFEAGRVSGLDAVALDERGAPCASVRIDAKVVVLAGSAVGSAALALASGLPDPHDQLGRDLRMHPGAVAAGVFDGDLESWRGIPQSYECTELLDLGEGSDKRVWIIPAFAHPIGCASMLPGFGADHMRAMREYPRLAVFTAMVHDETRGRVTLAGGRPMIDYRLSEADRAQLAKGLVACARLLFAAGAREVTIPAIPPVRLRSSRELDGLDTSFVRPHGVPMTAVHHMGSLRMGEDERASVVDSTGEHHQVRGLFVADGSLFPTSLGGPPQISIYAFARHLAPFVIQRAKRS
ncbi:MAG TPA: GMC family oxidoreductase [Polyangiaceae bacterium]